MQPANLTNDEAVAQNVGVGDQLTDAWSTPTSPDCFSVERGEGHLVFARCRSGLLLVSSQQKWRESWGLESCM